MILMDVYDVLGDGFKTRMIDFQKPAKETMNNE
jgi:hypothetical protein